MYLNKCCSSIVLRYWQATGIRIQIIQVTNMKSKATEVKTYQIVYEFFAQQIFEGKLKLGSRLPPERDISEALGVSRNSVREGIRMLEMLGFVESRQGSGNYIRSEPDACMTEALHLMFVLKNIEYADLHRTRRAIELEALELAVNSITTEILEDLHDLLTHMENCPDPEEFYFLERGFHRHMIEASRNEFLIFLNVLTSELEIRLFETQRLTLKTQPQHLPPLRDIHRSLYHRLLIRDGVQARSTLTCYFSMIEELSAS